MNELSAQAILFAYYLVLGILAIFGGHRLFLLAVYYRTRSHKPPVPDEPDVWPRITVQLPLYNEFYVAERLIHTVCALDYPADRLEIQVLDDSTDDTRQRVARLVSEYRTQGVRIEHIHRVDRTGFKAGALEAGLTQASGDLIAVFDADFVPDRDFLRRAVPHFNDPQVGMVQACWDHLNRDYSLLTRIQAVLLDGHFLIEHAARYRSGRFFNFNGTAGIWRRQAILDAGGWQHDTLTEDLDLSYRAQLAGWRFVFLQDLLVPSELPVDINGFKRQQFRWAKGSVQTGRKLLRRILSSTVPLRVKIESLFHLTNNASYFLMVVLSLLVFPAMIIRRGSSAQVILMIDLPLFMCATLSVLAFYAASQWVRYGSLKGRLRHLVPLMGLGIGLAVNNSRAVLEGLGKEVGVFERTPKYRIESRRDGWRSKKYRASVNLSLLLEGLLASWFAAIFVIAWKMGMWLSLPFLYLFLQGYSYMFLLSTLSLRGRMSSRDSLSKAQ